MKWFSTVCVSLFALVLTALMGNAQSPNIVDYFEERTFQYTNGKYRDAEIKYRLHTPKTIRYGRKYPLILHLHGIGEAGSDNIASLAFLDSILPLMVGSKRQDFFLLATQCPADDRGWSFRSTKDGTLDVLMAAMEHVIAENPIDEKRITIVGLSSDGWGVWELLLRHPDQFAGAVPTSCSVPRHIQKLAALKRTPIWSIVNKEDAGIDIESIRTAMHVVNNAGGSMVSTETNAHGHNAFIPAMKDYDCFRWMLAQKRGSWFAPKPGTIVYNAPRPLWLAVVMYIFPLSIIAFIVFLAWETVCEQAITVAQFVRERLGKG